MDETIAALATPFGQGSIAVARVSGAGALDVLAKVFRPAGGGSGELPARVHVLGHVADASGEVVDQVLVSVFPGPHSYTGEDVVEISGHGGVLVARRILDALHAAGARAAQPGEFTQRAFLNGKMDLTQAEAVMDLIEARTDLALRAAHAQLEGRLGGEAMRLREEIVQALAHIEAHIDFPEDDIDPETGAGLRSRLEAVGEGLDALLATAEQGRILREGVLTVICGAPNVGKSSILNVLLGMDRAIVSDLPGTTRDTIEEVINLRGIPLRLVDTAGVRESEDRIEIEGIHRTEKQIEQAELVLEVVDASLPREQEVAAIKARRHILVLNKADLGTHPSWNPDDGVAMSCLSGEGTEELVDAIYGRITHGEVDWGGNTIAINARHRDCFTRARGFLNQGVEALQEGRPPEFVALEIRSALEAVGEVVGKADAEEILGEIFGRFCIGK